MRAGKGPSKPLNVYDNSKRHSIISPEYSESQFQTSSVLLSRTKDIRWISIAPALVSYFKSFTLYVRYMFVSQFYLQTPLARAFFVPLRYGRAIGLAKREITHYLGTKEAIRSLKWTIATVPPRG